MLHTERMRSLVSQISFVDLVVALPSSRNAPSINLITEGNAIRPASVFSAMARNRLAYHLDIQYRRGNDILIHLGEQIREVLVLEHNHCKFNR